MTDPKRLPQDDGLICRDAGDWAKDKLYYLERYIDIFLTGMKDKPFRAFNYIDLFAGPGKDLVRESGEIILGSPLRALSHPRPFTSYYLVEIKSDFVEALKERVKAFDRASRVKIRSGDANAIVVEIIEEIQRKDREYIRDAWSSLNLAFIDPDDLEARWVTIESLTRAKTMDLVIHYPVMGLNRYMPLAIAEHKDTRVDKFFGTTGWRAIYEEHSKKGRTQTAHRELIDLYRKRLEERGYEGVKVPEPEPLMRTAETQAPLYRLIFASKHERGHEYWRKITGVDPSGQRDLFSGESGD